MSEPIPNWTAICMQVLANVASVSNSREEARHMIATRLDHWQHLIAEMDAPLGRRLLLFPEFALTSSPQRETTEAWIDKACLAIPGPEIERVQKWASQYKTYIAMHAYTTIPTFPGRFFNSAILIDPAGDILLISHRIHTGIAASPHDMLKEFLDKLGIDGLFPVAKTERGQIGMVNSTDLVWPEVPRALTLRGAEVLLHPTSETPANKVQFDYVRRARAVENMLYVVSCNIAGSAASPATLTGKAAELPAVSRIFDLDGKVVAESPEGESTQCRGSINVADVRRRRSDPKGLNFIAGLRVETFRDIYDNTHIYPANTWTAATKDFRSTSARRNEMAIENMRKIGILPDA